MSTDQTGISTKIGGEIIEFLINNITLFIQEVRKGLFWGLGFGFAIWTIVQIFGDFI